MLSRGASSRRSSRRRATGNRRGARRSAVRFWTRSTASKLQALVTIRHYRRGLSAVASCKDREGALSDARLVTEVHLEGARERGREGGCVRARAGRRQAKIFRGRGWC